LVGGSPAGGTYSGTGVSGGMFNPTTAGAGNHTISYSYTDGLNCTSSTSSTITVHPDPTVTLNNFSDVCLASAQVVLTGGNPSGGSYAGAGVSNGIFDPSIAGVGTQNITYSYTDAFNCSSSSSATIHVNPSPTVSLSNDTIICVYNTLLIDAGAGFNSYDWSTGATSQTILADTNGTGSGVKTYSVIVTNSSNCPATDSIDVTFDICSQVPQTSFITSTIVYPNPFRDAITLITDKKDGVVTMYDPLGKIILSTALNNESMFIIHPKAPAGIYFLKVEKEGTVETFKVVKY
jgi:hypothetical protein